jgi:hypothetical protein
MNWLLLPAPLLLLFECWQLYMAERYLGLRRIAQGVDPRRLPMGHWAARLWAAGALAVWLWLPLLLLAEAGRAAGACMLFLSVAGHVLRRASPLRWVLVLLTLEGACRIGLMGFLTVWLLRHGP